MPPESRPLLALLLLSAAPTDACRDLARLSRPDLTITALRSGAVCQVEATARPAIRIELHLPDPARWSGRYYQMGNGGFAGRIDRATLAAAAARGDVAAATDTGHVGDGFDASWASGRPDLVRDYAWRSIKVTSDVARRVTRAYYGRDARRRYFMGCSYGGRQALVAAGRWPADWDGVIAGAPAIRWRDRLAAFGRIADAVRAPGAGLTEGELKELIATQDRSRLTPAQDRGVAEVEAVGYPVAQADAAEWARWIYGPDRAAPGQARLGDQARAYLGDARAVDFDVPSLARFAARGGRVLSYFGEADAVLPPAEAIPDARSIGAQPAFYRLFLVPGMAHCQGGATPHAFGQSLPAPAGRDDPAHDIRRALEAWVEEGRRPERLIAVDPADPRRKVVLTPAL
jgi:feruloyl esterase